MGGEEFRDSYAGGSTVDKKEKQGNSTVCGKDGHLAFCF